MKRIWKKLAAVACYLSLMAFFFDFRIGELFDLKQFLIWMSGTGLLLLPSLGERDQKETGNQKRSRISRCGLWASFLESFLLCFALLGQVSGTAGLLREFARCLRPLLYGVCLWTVFVEAEGEQVRQREKGEKESFREITVSESHRLFLQMGLTKRECEIAVLVCRGMSNGEIAEELCISEATVKKHISNIFEKLKCNRREQIRERLFS